MFYNKAVAESTLELPYEAIPMGAHNIFCGQNFVILIFLIYQSSQLIVLYC